MRVILTIAASLALVATWGSGLVVPVQGSARTQPSRPVVAPVHFRLAGSANYVVSDGRYVLLNDVNDSGSTLIDAQTGKRTYISGCRGYLLGGPWLLSYCPEKSQLDLELYGLSSGHRQVVQTGVVGYPTAVGAYWIEFHQSSSGAYVFQNIQTGQVRTLAAWRPGGRTIPDLNSPSLTRKVCTPLAVPHEWTSYARWSTERDVAGGLTFEGKFAIAEGTNHPDSSGAYTQQTYVERCGSRLHKRLLPGWEALPNDPLEPLVANSHAVLWGGEYSQTLNGVALPSLRSIKIPVPSDVIEPYVVALSSRTLYLLDYDNQLWTAPSPQTP